MSARDADDTLIHGKRPDSWRLTNSPVTPKNQSKEKSAATGIYRWSASQVGRNLIAREGLHRHLHETNEWAAEVRPLPAAAIDDYSHAGDLAAVLPNDVDRFLYSPAARHNIFGDNELFVRRNLKAAAQHQSAGFLFREDVAFA